MLGTVVLAKVMILKGAEFVCDSFPRVNSIGEWFALGGEKRPKQATR